MSAASARLTGAQSERALGLLGAFRIDDGRLWGEAAHPFQREDVAAILDPAGPRRHFLLRARGMAKTGDTAGLGLALMLAAAPPSSVSLAYAVDEDQAQLMLRAIRGIVARSPSLADFVELTRSAVVVRRTGAVLQVESSDAASAFGQKPWLTLVDELAAWPATDNHESLWSAIVSAVPKHPDGRLIVLTSGGSPLGIGARVWEQAQASPAWRTSRHPGPSPWWSAEDIAATRAALTDAQWARLIQCEFASGSGALTSADDVDAAIRTAPVELPYRPGRSYVLALDLGWKADLSALSVGHTEERSGATVTVIDAVRYWRPTASQRVDFAEVERGVRELYRRYHARVVLFDPSQAAMLTQQLERSGVRTEQFTFSASSVNEIARGLFIALRDRLIELPPDTEVRTQFVATQLVETPTGVKLNNPTGFHDDLPTTAGMIVSHFQRHPLGLGQISVPAGPPILRTLRDARPAAPMRQQLQLARRAMPSQLPGGGPILLPGQLRDARDRGTRWR